jgi:taurine dioxygenase
MQLPLTPLEGGFGATVDLDLGRRIAPGLVKALTSALHRHRLLVFPDQHLNHADLLTVSALFGTVDTDTDRRYAVGGFPGITVVSNIAEGGVPVGIYDGDQEEEWHADASFKPILTKVTLLYSVIAAQVGGETRFADATRSYGDLPAAARERLEGLRTVHSIHQLAARQAQAAAGQSSVAAGTLVGRAAVEHPLVTVHPVTGANSLLLGSMVVQNVVGLEAHESATLLDELLAHATSPPYIHTHHWCRGDLVVWDNLALLHTASPCDSSRHPRLLFRTAVR